MSSQCLSTSSATELAIFYRTEENILEPETIFIRDHTALKNICQVPWQSREGLYVFVVNYAVKSGCERTCASNLKLAETHPVPLVLMESPGLF